MRKYEIKIMPIVEGFVMTEYKYKTVTKSELNEHLNEGWVIHRKKYFIITYFLDFWRSLNTDQKITISIFIIGSIITIIIAFIGWIYFVK